MARNHWRLIALFRAALPLGEIAEPLIEPCAPLGRSLEDPHPGSHRVDVRPGQIPVDLAGFGSVELRDRRQVGRVERARIFERLFLALGHREQGQPFKLPPHLAGPRAVPQCSFQKISPAHNPWLNSPRGRTLTPSCSSRFVPR